MQSHNIAIIFASCSGMFLLGMLIDLAIISL